MTGLFAYPKVSVQALNKAGINPDTRFSVYE